MKRAASNHGPNDGARPSSEALAAPQTAPGGVSTLDASVETPPGVTPGLDMRRPWSAIHTQSVERAPAEHRIGRYFVHGTLGQGSMGRVLRARDETLGREVALKVLHEASQGRQEQRLLREAQALARLSHTNIVRVYDVAEIDGRLCMAMELVEGTPLLQWQRARRPWREVLAVYLQAGWGLQAAHAEGLVHRDFKPANCILDARGVVKVLDFGLARGAGGYTGSRPIVELDGTTETDRSRASEERPTTARAFPALEQELTRTGTVLGTPAYMAPEQLMGQPAESSSDQFAFCVSLYEALYGVRPFPGKTELAILAAIHALPVEPRSVGEGLPPVPKWLHEILRRGLSVSTHQRWPSMHALLTAVERGVARRRRIRNGVLGVAVATGLGAASLASDAWRAEPPCQAIREQGMLAWTDADRIGVSEALEATMMPEGSATSEWIQTRLDAHAAEWIDSRVDACEATWVRHEVVEDDFRLRMACLDDKAAQTRAIVDQLANTDADTAVWASDVVDELPRLATCDDIDELRRGPQPIPETLADDAARVRALVAQSWARGAGDGEHGLEAADRAVDSAETLVEAPILALEALQNRGSLLRVARRWAESRRDLEAALELSERLDSSSRAIDVLVDLVILAYDEGNDAAVDAWLSVLRGRLARHENEPRRVAQRSWLVSLEALRSGRNDDAVEAAEHALRQYALLDPPVNGERVEALMSLGDAHLRLDHVDAARGAFEQARDLAQAESRLPLVLDALRRLGYLHYVQGQPESTRPLLERALELCEEFHGGRVVSCIRTRLLLAQTLYYQGELSLAIRQASLARGSLDERTSPQLRGEVLELVGALHRAQAQWDAAIESYREARAAWQTAPDRTQLAFLDGNIADCYLAKGDHAKARALYDDVLALLDATAPEHPDRAYPLLGRGQLANEQGRREDAIVDLRAALAIDRGHDQSLAAELRWALALALAPNPQPGEESTHEASAVARVARELFARLGDEARIKEIDAWLEQCGARCRA